MYDFFWIWNHRSSTGLNSPPIPTSMVCHLILLSIHSCKYLFVFGIGPSDFKELILYPILFPCDKLLGYFLFFLQAVLFLQDWTGSGRWKVPALLVYPPLDVGFCWLVDFFCRFLKSDRLKSVRWLWNVLDYWGLCCMGG